MEGYRDVSASNSGEMTPLASNRNSFFDENEQSSRLTDPTSKYPEHLVPFSESYSSHQSGNNNGNKNHNNKLLNAEHADILFIPASPKKLLWKEKIKCIFALSASILALVLCVLALILGTSHEIMTPLSSKLSNKTLEPKLFDDEGRYVYEDYDAQTPFADFLNGLSGIYGKPMYAFFVNRGQAIASFGVESKDTPIMEFFAANKAYQNTPLIGFRTFIQGRRGSGAHFVFEPFSPMETNYLRFQNSAKKGRSQEPEKVNRPLFNNKRILYSGENDLQIQEVDLNRQVETNVTYFVLPEEDFGAFVRRTTITNTNPKESMTISVLDGLARIQPAGGKIDSLLKTMGRTLEGFMSVFFPYENSITMPFFRLTTKPSDTDFIETQEIGHYCVSILEKENSNHLLPIIYDPSKIFGHDTTFLQPIELYKKSVGEIINSPQYGKAKTSSCFAAIEQIILQPRESVTLSTVFGVADSVLEVPVIVRRLIQEGFILYKLARTKEVVRQVTKNVETQTASEIFNAHVSQMFLDNSLRGGIPIVLGDQDSTDGTQTVDEDPALKVYHVFSRIHGDLERDYNDFQLPYTFFSQGPGFFRDVAQNRRNDVVFNPRIGSFNVKTFLSLIQADGYEPYSVEAVVFTISDKNKCDEIAIRAVGPADGHRAQREALSGILYNGPFRPGQLLQLMVEQNIFLMVSFQKFIDMVAIAATSTPMAVYKKGFWADHWTYYLDMIEAYISIYPDQEEALMFETTIPYFFSPASVQPRRRKYVENLSYKGDQYHIQQLDATIEDASKRNYMNKFIAEKTGWYSLKANWQHDEEGNIFESSVFGKLFLLATLKFATRDVYGMGIEYEGGRPGWNDANNGIPGMLGSGMPETFELKAMIVYLLQVTKTYGRGFSVPQELFHLFESINGNLTAFSKTKGPHNPLEMFPWDSFSYWDKISTAREVYRELTKINFSGKTVMVDADTAINAFNRWLKEIDQGINRAMAIGTKGYADDGNSGIIPTYFAYQVTRWDRTGERNRDGHPLVVPLNMTVRQFPLFLEGPTRMMKTVNTRTARDIYLKVRNSSLHDEDLNMYTLSASLMDQPIEMGRSTAFAPGWLENQSVWLHMSYKFYLQLLRNQLYDDFFVEMKSGGLLPFVDAQRYGRSPMECSSFLASSAFEDPAVRGRGFLGRLSGSTAEFLSIWIIMFLGPKLYSVDPRTNDLRMQLMPTLPAWLFKQDDVLEMEQRSEVPRVRFKLFSSITVHYYNPDYVDIMGIPPNRYKVGLRDGSVFEFNQTFITSDMAEKIRRVVLVDYIECHFN